MTGSAAAAFAAPASRYLVTPIAVTDADALQPLSQDIARINSFGQVVMGRSLWTPSPRNGVFGASATLPAYGASGLLRRFDIADDGKVFGATYANLNPIDGYPRLWVPTAPNSAPTQVWGSSTLGLVATSFNSSGEFVWPVRVLSSGAVQHSIWRPGAPGAAPTQTRVAGTVPVSDGRILHARLSNAGTVVTTAYLSSSQGSMDFGQVKVFRADGSTVTLREGTSVPTSGLAMDVNAGELIVGAVRDGTGKRIPTRWVRSSSGAYVEQQLGPATPRSSFGYATAVDNSGNAVGVDFDNSFGSAVMWTGDQPNSTVLLQDRLEFHSGRGLALTIATDINSLGQITGLARNAAGQTQIVLLTPLRDGDANVDQRVNFDDLLVLAANYNRPADSWLDADFTGDGLVNFDDLLSLAANYNTGAAGDWAMAQAAIPEPASLLAGAVVPALSLARRRRR